MSALTRTLLGMDTTRTVTAYNPRCTYTEEHVAACIGDEVGIFNETRTAYVPHTIIAAALTDDPHRVSLTIEPKTFFSLAQ